MPITRLPSVCVLRRVIVCPLFLTCCLFLCAAKLQGQLGPVLVPKLAALLDSDRNAVLQGTAMGLLLLMWRHGEAVNRCSVSVLCRC